MNKISGDQKTSHFIGIGVKKAGTTWLYQCLAEHPDICMSSPKETEFFMKSNIDSIEEYDRHFAHCDSATHTIKGEYSPRYISNTRCAEQIARHLPQAKLIVVFRNPVDQLISHFQHNITKGVLEANTLSDAIRQKPKQQEKCLYAKHLEKWLELFPREQFHFFLYDDIQNDPAGTIKKLYSFLGVEDSFVPDSLSLHYNTSASRRRRFFWLARKIYLRALRHRFGRSMIRLVKYLGLRKLIHRTPRKNQGCFLYFSKDTRHELREYYRNDILSLQHLIRRDLSMWLSDGQTKQDTRD